MPNGPEQRRVAERRDELAPHHQHAASLGQRLGLGPVTGLFVRETQTPGQIALGMLLIGLVVSVCLVPIGVGETGAAPMWAGWAVAAGLLVVIVLLGRVFFRPGRHWWLYLFQGGLVVLDHRGRVRESVRWAEVDQVDWEWSPHEESAGASLGGYRLSTHDGRTVRLSTAFDNAYDPYAPVVGILRALSPRIGEVLAQFPTLAESLDAAAVQPLARRALDRLAAGQTLVFGKVTVDRHGLTYAKEPALPWGDLTGWKLDDGQLKLERAAGRRKRLVIPMPRVDGGWILIRLLAERAPASGT